MIARAAAGSRRPSGATLLVALALLTALAALAVVDVRAHESTLTRPEQVQQIAAGLRCPVCRDLSAADSPAPLARQMRRQIAEQLRDGQSAQAIRQHFVAAYGDSVLMSPPHHGAGQVAHVLPLLVLGTGVLVGVRLLRRWRRGEEPGWPSRS